MRILGSAVITMEALIMGFALLLAMENHGAVALSLGGLLALACLLTAGLMKKKIGWLIGTALQAGLIAYGLVVPSMYFIGALFGGLWATAFFLGRKGEAIRAKLIAERDQNSPI
jgi:hypothetical protein